jgi:hypothetical protein
MADDLDHIHDEALYPGALVKRLIREYPRRDPEFVTTHWLSERLGMSAEWWQDAAREKKIPGCWQDSPGSPWYLPSQEARAYLLRVQTRKSTLNSRSARGPYRRAS